MVVPHLVNSTAFGFVIHIEEQIPDQIQSECHVDAKNNRSPAQLNFGFAHTNTDKTLLYGGHVVQLSFRITKSMIAGNVTFAQFEETIQDPKEIVRQVQGDDRNHLLS